MGLTIQQPPQHHIGMAGALPSEPCLSHALAPGLAEITCEMPGKPLGTSLHLEQSSLTLEPLLLVSLPLESSSAGPLPCAPPSLEQRGEMAGLHPVVSQSSEPIGESPVQHLSSVREPSSERQTFPPTPLSLPTENGSRATTHLQSSSNRLQSTSLSPTKSAENDSPLGSAALLAWRCCNHLSPGTSPTTSPTVPRAPARSTSSEKADG